MQTKFRGKTVQLANTQAKLVFPAELDQRHAELRKNMSSNQHIHYDLIADSLEKQIEMQIECGASGLLLMGVWV